MRRYRCRACRHPQRDVIDASLVLGALGRRQVAQQFGLHVQEILRHVRHLPAAPTPEAGEPASEVSLLSPRRAVVRVTYELEFLD